MLCDNDNVKDSSLLGGSNVCTLNIGVITQKYLLSYILHLAKAGGMEFCTLITLVYSFYTMYLALDLVLGSRQSNDVWGTETFINPSDLND